MEHPEREGHMGLAGMLERIETLGGSVELRSTSPGAALIVRVPAVRDEGAATP
jgi:signal transduction histidine kinase